MFLKNKLKKSLLGLALATSSVAFAGNETRSGQAGATELLVNPWTRSAGWGGANAASVRGLEAQFLNVAGTAFTKKTEFGFARTNYLQGSGIFINAFGLTQHVGASGVLGLSVNSMNFGAINITTVEQPDGTLGTYTPQLSNLNLSYAKEFSNSIYGGFNLKVISESISNVTARGVALDAGIQYLTGINEEKNNIHFGIALKNVGPTLKFSGDGLSFRGYAPQNGYVPVAGNSQTTMTLQQRTEQFEMPSLLSIAGAYDFKLTPDHRLSFALNYIANSFTRDQSVIGLEYGFKSYLMVRGGYTYEKKSDLYTNFMSGPSAGITFELPLNKKGSTFCIDYSYRATNPMKGVHTFGARINL